MPLFFLLVLLLFPVLEIAVFIEVGGSIGTWPTVGAIFLTAVIGINLVRAQGLATIGRARASLQRNEFPLEEAFDGICLAIAGLMLLIPGFVTDGLGGLLLIPPLRARLRRFILGRGHFQVPPGAGGRPGQDGQTIDGQYHVVDDEKPPEDPNRLGRG